MRLVVKEYGLLSYQYPAFLHCPDASLEFSMLCEVGQRYQPLFQRLLDELISLGFKLQFGRNIEKRPWVADFAKRRGPVKKRRVLTLIVKMDPNTGDIISTEVQHNIKPLAPPKVETEPSDVTESKIEQSSNEPAASFDSSLRSMPSELHSESGDLAERPGYQMPLRERVEDSDEKK